jgi:hypothetical protein
MQVRSFDVRLKAAATFGASPTSRLKAAATFGASLTSA